VFSSFQCPYVSRIFRLSVKILPFHNDWFLQNHKGILFSVNLNGNNHIKKIHDTKAEYLPYQVVYSSACHFLTIKTYRKRLAQAKLCLYNVSMKNESNKLNEAQEAKNALLELSNITLDKYVEDKKKSYEQKKKPNRGRKSI
jgi:hypothetical protein